MYLLRDIRLGNLPATVDIPPAWLEADERGVPQSDKIEQYLDHPPPRITHLPLTHRWELPVLRYHKILLTYPYPFFVVITQLFS